MLYVTLVQPKVHQPSNEHSSTNGRSKGLFTSQSNEARYNDIVLGFVEALMLVI